MLIGANERGRSWPWDLLSMDGVGREGETVYAGGLAKGGDSLWTTSSLKPKKFLLLKELVLVIVGALPNIVCWEADVLADHLLH